MEFGKVYLRPRKIVRHCPDGSRQVIKGVMPKPFGPKEAEAFFDKAYGPGSQGVVDLLKNVMPDEEVAFVYAVWDAKLSPAACWMDAFYAIFRSDIEVVTPQLESVA